MYTSLIVLSTVYRLGVLYIWEIGEERGFIEEEEDITQKQHHQQQQLLSES